LQLVGPIADCFADEIGVDIPNADERSSFLHNSCNVMAAEVKQFGIATQFGDMFGEVIGDWTEGDWKEVFAFERGRSIQTGLCDDINSSACPTNFNPVCASDGNTYSNQCRAHAAGVPVMSRGECGVTPSSSPSLPSPPRRRRSRSPTASPSPPQTFTGTMTANLPPVNSEDPPPNSTGTMSTNLPQSSRSPTASPSPPRIFTDTITTNLPPVNSKDPPPNSTGTMSTNLPQRNSEEENSGYVEYSSATYGRDARSMLGAAVSLLIFARWI